MEKKLAALLALLVLSGSLAACKRTPPVGDSTGTEETGSIFAPGTGNRDETGREDPTDPETETNGSSGQETATGTETAESETSTEPEQIRIPAEEPADLTAILRGETAGCDLQYDFADTSLDQIRADGNLRLSQSGSMQAGAAGLTVPADRWAAVGFSRSMTAPCTVRARMSTQSADPSAQLTSAVMLGVRLTDPGHIYSDSGIWFILRDRAVFARIGGREIVWKLATGKPTALSAGAELRIEDEGSVLHVFLDEQPIATAYISETDVRLLDENGKEVASLGLKSVAHGENLGYVRILSHQTDGCLMSLSASSRAEVSYTTTPGTVALKAERDYLFRDRQQYRMACPVVQSGEHFFADAQTLADLFGFDCRADGDTVTLDRRLLSLTFRVGEANVDVNGTATPFPTVLREEGVVLLCADWLADMMGYTAVARSEAGMLYIFPEDAGDTDGAIAGMNEQYRLYEETVYAPLPTDIDTSGVGKYGATDPADRLVGIAYTAGHTAAKTWGEEHPLLGAYTSDDRDVIYRHGVWLAAAGVDFVYVDWSRNTLFDLDSAGDKRSEYRMIEESTDLLFEIWSTIPGAPRICILIGPGTTGPIGIAGGNQQKKADQVYAKYAEKYPDLYFTYEGKPLLLCYAGTPTRLGAEPAWSDDRFTVRWMTDYTGAQAGLADPTDLVAPLYWSRRDRDAQILAVRKSLAEAISCSAAWSGLGKEGDAVYVAGRGFESGETLRRQFARADALGAHIVLVNAWNEWAADSMGASADLEPSESEGSFRYDLLCELIRQYKN